MRQALITEGTRHMTKTLTGTTRRRLDIQGFDRIENEPLAQVAPWLRLAFGLCALLSGVGTAMTSTTILLILVPIAFLGALFPVHPFDLIYNYGIRHITGTSALPRRGAPNRFACGLAVMFLVGTIWAFEAGNFILGYVIGGSMTAVAVLVSTTDICIPSLIYRSLFGFPNRR